MSIVRREDENEAKDVFLHTKQTTLWDTCLLLEIYLLKQK